MKKIYVLLFVTVGLIFAATAQPFEKGQKLLGGSLYFAHGNNDDGYFQSSTNYNAVGLSPAFGIFTKQNRLTGITLSYQHTGSSSNSNPKIKGNSYGTGIYRQYWSSLGNNFYFIIQGQLSASYATSSFSSTGIAGNSKREEKSYNAYFSVDPGFAYRVKKKLILDFYYSNFVRSGYSYAKNDVTDPGTAKITYKSNSFVFDTGLRNFSLDQLRFGFRFLL